MCPTQPDGEAAPPDGSLPPHALAGLQVVPGEIRSGDRFGAYVHVPYCATRCGYCDFNTYTPGELGNSTTGLSQSDEVTSYLTAVMAEVELAARVLSEDGSRALPIVDTVFIGGGTPTQLAPDQLGGILRRLDETFGLAPDAEITTEANPESVTARQLAELRTAGFTRISLGMQSAVEHVLSVLDRSHTPGRALEAAKQARTEGFAHVSLDLIYGTPTESDDDWRASLQAAISADVDHISAYALTVEPGTRMARQVARGELAMIDDDVLADRYQLADRILSEAGFSWYEISNWARTPGDRCRHNELYWRGGDWWGFGPGAHSHAGGVRWWNVKHPAAYARRLASGESPAQARELLGRGQRAVEDVMLRVRLVEGFPLDELDDRGRSGAAAAVAQGLLNPKAHHIGTAQLTLRGRLLTDTVVRMLSN